MDGGNTMRERLRALREGPRLPTTPEAREGAGSYYDLLGLHGNAEKARSGEGFHATVQAFDHFRLADTPIAITEQACTIGLSGRTVTIDCDSREEAEALMDWLIERAGGSDG